MRGRRWAVAAGGVNRSTIRRRPAHGPLSPGTTGPYAERPAPSPSGGRSSTQEPAGRGKSGRPRMSGAVPRAHHPHAPDPTPHTQPSDRAARTAGPGLPGADPAAAEATCESAAQVGVEPCSHARLPIRWSKDSRTIAASRTSRSSSVISSICRSATSWRTAWARQGPCFGVVKRRRLYGRRPCRRARGGPGRPRTGWPSTG